MSFALPLGKFFLLVLWSHDCHLQEGEKNIYKRKGIDPSGRSWDLFPSFSESHIKKKGHFAKWKQCCTELLCIIFQVCNCDCVMDLSRE